MRLLISILTLFIFGQACSQDKSTDDFVKTIEKLRKEKRLTSKHNPDKTFVGALYGYYDKDSLVLINSLTDAEAAMTETLYYIQNGLLRKVYIMAAQLNSNDEWKKYGSKHDAIENCYSCHGNPNVR